MPKYGSAFSGTDPLKFAPGTSHNAGIRAFKNYFNLAVDGNILDSFLIAKIGGGNVVDQFKIESSVNLSALNITIGTLANPTKYSAAVAGPNATTLIIQPPLALALAVTDAEEIYMFPSLAWPAAGLVRTTTQTTKR